jgi:hypothetical protein
MRPPIGSDGPARTISTPGQVEQDKPVEKPDEEYEREPEHEKKIEEAGAVTTSEPEPEPEHHE